VAGRAAAKVGAGGTARLSPGPLPTEHNAFVRVYRGAARIGGEIVPAEQMAIPANEGDGVVIEAQEEARLILVAGRLA